VAHSVSQTPDGALNFNWSAFLLCYLFILKTEPPPLSWFCEDNNCKVWPFKGEE